MAEYTPGPWTVEYSEATKILDRDDCTVAFLGHVHLGGRRPSGQVGATARLIAAAPAMLEAMKDAWESLDMELWEESEVAHRFHQVIAQAEGRDA